MSETLYFETLRLVVLWTSPVVLLAGIFLISYGKYNRLDSILEKELGVGKKLIPKLEENIYTFHEWCVKKNVLIGLICIIYSVAMYLVLGNLTLPTDIVG